MKAIFYHIDANELWYYITKCSVNDPAYAASCIQGFVCLALLCPVVMFYLAMSH